MQNIPNAQETHQTIQWHKLQKNPKEDATSMHCQS